MLRLFDSSGNQVASNDNGAAPGETLGTESYLDYTFAADGRYYVGISGHGNATYDTVTGDGDATGSTGGYSLLIIMPGVGNTWFDQNLHDATLVALGRSLAADNVLSRDDMISLLTAAGSDDGVVDATELADLRLVVTKASTLGMPDYVRALSSKVVNTDTANARFQGATLGNLAAGSPAARLNNLIAKWFLGADHPVARNSSNTATYSYALCQGTLFVNGVAYTDIRQGDLGDCYYVAALAETAARSPSTIQSMFIDNGDNTWTVRLYRNGVADYVTVDRYLPVSGSGRLVFAGTGDLASSSTTEMWVALAEKAYAQINESGWIGQDGANSYQGLSGGWPDDALGHITGRGTAIDYTLTSSDFTTIVNAWNAGRQICICTSNHAYALVGYNAATQVFTIYNPWGTAASYTWSQVLATFVDWQSTTT